ncbi:methyltransferase domain-containing protein [Novosphingobium sp.]|uniref:methyltransferase domain-containing protein n=1 Tax=Novosphingobium sp. TaxID=1874826 RepID=UPI0025EB4867|nr:methyltransferase domain-containing protein [Novosphingobium sp.]
MYPAQWHQVYGDKTGTSARAILPPIIDIFGAHSLVEVGCGNAHWTQSGLDAGITDYAVVDGPWNDRRHLLVDAARFHEADLSHPLDLGRRFDLAVCLEVAEHVPASSAEVLVRSLCDLSDVIVFGAAIPFQGGFGHINEQWPSWWRALFAAAGYRPYDLIRLRHWENREIHYWYRQNAFVYVRETNAAQRIAAERASGGASFLPFDAVHPEKFAEIASYEGIALKRLIAALPSWLGKRLRAKLGGMH